MTLPRSRNRYQQGRESGPSAAAAAMPPSRQARNARKADSGWPAPWMPWAVGFGLVLAGALFAFLSLNILARSVISEPSTGKGGHRTLLASNAAAVLGPEPMVTAAPGEQVELDWVIKNAGQTDWPAYRYRFAPAEGEAAPVISVPRDLTEAEVTTLHALVTVPDTPGIWRPSWDLTGPGGKVEGGHLTAQIIVTDGKQP